MEEEMKKNQFQFSLKNWYDLYLYKVEEQRKYNKLMAFKKELKKKWKK